jgi:hypothetical protein
MLTLTPTFHRALSKHLPWAVLTVATALAGCAGTPKSYHDWDYSSGGASATGAAGEGGASASTPAATGLEPCDLQPEDVTAAYCDQDTFERLFVCPAEAKPVGCTLAAVTGGHCCPAVQTQTETYLFSCGIVNAGSPNIGYAARGYVEVVAFEGYEGGQQVKLTELAASATAFSTSAATGAQLVSDHMVHPSSSSDFDFWGVILPPFAFGTYSSTDPYASELEVRKDANTRCGSIDGVGNCFVEPLNEGESIAPYTPDAAMECELSQSYSWP